MLPRALFPVGGALMLSLVSIQSEERVNDPTSFTWNPELSPTGPVIVTVDLQKQTAAVYRNDVLIGSCIVSTGRKGYETPTGVFHILEKDADHRSSTYNNAPMPYQERLTWGGVALHAGSLPGYPSSHGCIHLPYEFSKKLFGITEMGGTVVITDGPGSGVSTSHQVHFKDGDDDDIHWQPHDSPSGPVSILYSEADKAIMVVRNGVLIGRGAVQHSPFAKKPKGTYTYVMDGWINDQKSGETVPHWHQVGGPADSHLIKTASHLKMDPRLRHAIEAVMKPGTTLVMTDEPMTDATRSAPGFQILSGGNPVAKAE